VTDLVNQLQTSSTGPDRPPRAKEIRETDPGLTTLLARRWRLAGQTATTGPATVAVCVARTTSPRSRRGGPQRI
jgi:hypothetical protein